MVTDVLGMAGRAESLINEINTEERITQQEACDADHKSPVFLKGVLRHLLHGPRFA